MVEWRAPIKDHPGTKTMFSVLIGRCFPKVHVKIADVAILVICNGPHLYTPVDGFLWHVLPKEHSNFVSYHGFIDSHLSCKYVGIEKGTLAELDEWPDLVQRIIPWVVSSWQLGGVIEMEISLVNASKRS